MQKPPWATWPPHPAESAGTYASRMPTEAELIAADLKRNEDKKTGRLQQQEIARGHAAEVRLGMHNVGGAA